MENLKKILITNDEVLNRKLDKFINSYNFNVKDLSKKDKIIYVTDFDFTLTEKYNYDTGERLFSTYEMYNQDIIGGNNKEFNAKREEIKKVYMKYEDDPFLEKEIKKEKMKEWNEIVLNLMIHPNLRRKSITEMVNKNKSHLKFRKNLKEFFEKLIKLNIPIIIVSGGIKEIIEDSLRTLCIKGYEEYIKKKRLFIIGNEFSYDETTEKCNGKKEVIYSHNKDIEVKKIVEKNFPNIEKVFVLGDYEVDYSSISKLGINDKDNIIGIGFINLQKSEIEKGIDINNNNFINSFQKVYDINFIANEGYDYLNQVFSKFDK